MTDLDGLVEITAAALYRTEPEMDQPVDLDGRATGPAFIVPWVTLCECYEPLAETVRQKARAILTAVLPRVLAGPREALEFYEDPETYHAIAFLADPPCGAFLDDFDEDHGHPDYDRPMPGKTARAELARIDKLTEGMSREGETDMNVAGLYDRVAAAIYDVEEERGNADRPRWAELSTERKAPWLKDAERVVKVCLTTGTVKQSLTVGDLDPAFRCLIDGEISMGRMREIVNLWLAGIPWRLPHTPSREGETG